MIIFGILICLLLSAFFSGMEMAFISANKLELELLKEKSEGKSSIITNFYSKSDSFLTTMLVGNNIALAAFTFFMTKFLSQYVFVSLNEGFLFLLVTTLVSTVIVLLFGEYLPKLLSSLHAEKFLFFFSIPLLVFKNLLFIPVQFTSFFSNRFLKSKKNEQKTHNEHIIGKTDLEYFIDDAVDDKQEDAIDKNLFTNVLRLDKIKVKECMIPRTEIVYVDKSIPHNELINVFNKYKHSRVLVTNDSIENVLGYIHHQQLLEESNTLNSSILPIKYIPESMNVKDLISLFRKDKMSIACVVDEFGSLSGLITMEDLVEEIFGEIEDEHDSSTFTDIRLENGAYILSGRTELDQLKSKYKELPIYNSEYQTISGFVTANFGKIPNKNERVIIENFEFICEEVSDTRVELVRVNKLI